MTLVFLGAAVGFWLALAGALTGWAGSWRRAFLAATTVLAVLLTLGTELWGIGPFHGRTWFLGWWTAVFWVIGIRVFRARPFPCLPFRFASAGPAGRRNTLFFLTALLGILLLTALASAPNNFDGMTYRLPRVMHWIQQGSLAPFATHNIRQLTHPWDEYVLLNLRMITGGDLLFNLVQTGAWIGTLVTTSMICKELVPGSRTGWLAALFAGTLPMALLQATGVQTDLLTAFWSSSFIYFFLLHRRTGSMAWLAAASASLGLALLTKVVAYFFLAPFCIWAVLSILRTPGRNRAASLLLLAGIALALNAGQFVRNVQLVGSPLGIQSIGKDVYHNETLNPGLLAANVVRNAAMHLQTPSAGVNAAVEGWLRGLHRGVGIDPDDPRITIHERFGISDQPMFEDTAGNPLHLALLLAAAVWMAIRWRSVPPPLRQYTVLCLCSFTVFCLALKWQVWNVRFHLIFFVLSAPWVAEVLGSAAPARLRSAFAVALAGVSLLWALNNQTRPLIGPETVLLQTRQATYYNCASGHRKDFEGVIGWLRERGVEKVGLALGPNDWEYPFWAFLDGVELQHVQVEGLSAKYERPDFRPDAVIYSRAFLSARRERWDTFFKGRSVKAFGGFVIAV